MQVISTSFFFSGRLSTSILFIGITAELMPAALNLLCSAFAAFAVVPVSEPYRIVTPSSPTSLPSPPSPPASAGSSTFSSLERTYCGA